jgi:hypothetical protein
MIKDKGLTFARSNDLLRDLLDLLLLLQVIVVVACLLPIVDLPFLAARPLHGLGTDGDTLPETRVLLVEALLAFVGADAEPTLLIVFVTRATITLKERIS